MKESKKHCDLESCMMCRLCIKEWKPAMEANRKNFHYKKEIKGKTIKITFVEDGILAYKKEKGLNSNQAANSAGE